MFTRFDFPSRRTGAFVRRGLLAVSVALCVSVSPEVLSDDRTPSVASGIPSTAAAEVRPVRVISREQIELSGASDLNDFLTRGFAYNDFGLRGPHVLGSSRMLVLLDGHRLYDQSLAYAFEALPLSAVERIEVLGASAAAVRDGGAVPGAINIVLRDDFEGAEFRTGAALPEASGGDEIQGSAVWGGPVGRGHMVVGLEATSRDEFPTASRENGAPSWTPGGSFRDTIGVSEFGNTVVYDGEGIPIGDCDEDDGYVGPLSGMNIAASGTACGYAARNYTFDLSPKDRQVAFVNVEHPAGDGAAVYLSARFAQVDDSILGPASAASFSFDPHSSLLDEINAERDADEQIPADASLVAYHYFLGHGGFEIENRVKAHDLALGMRVPPRGGVGWSGHIRSYRHTLLQDGGNIPNRTLLLGDDGLLATGQYDLADPLSTDETHLKAVRDSNLIADVDAIDERITAGLTLDGAATSLAGGPTLWAAGLEFDDWRHSDQVVFRNPEDPATTYTFLDIFGGQGFTYQGERRRVAASGELYLSPLDSVRLSLATRYDDHDDVGGALSNQIAGTYAAHPRLTLRGSWSRGARPPSMQDLYSPVTKSSVRICDTRFHTGALSDCDTVFVDAYSGGNPDLPLDEARSVRAGFRATLGPATLDADWFRIGLEDLAANTSAQQLVNLDAEGGSLPAGARVTRSPDDPTQITRIDFPIVATGEEDISGLDIRIGSEFEAGPTTVSGTLSWLHVLDSESRVAGFEPPGDYVKNRAHAAMRLGRENVTVGWDVHAFSGYDRVQGGGRFGGWVGHDVSMQLRDAFGVEGLSFTGGVLNLADRGPPLASTYPRSALTTLDSIRGRTFFLRGGIVW